MKKFKSADWSGLSYREVQKELASLRSNDNYIEKPSNSFMQFKQPTNTR